MLIQSMQVANPPVLPTLQAIPPYYTDDQVREREREIGREDERERVMGWC